MKLKVLLILAIALLVLILVPANGTLLEWLGLNGSLLANDLRRETVESPDPVRPIVSDSEQAPPRTPGASSVSRGSSDNDAALRILPMTGENSDSDRGAGDTNYIVGSTEALNEVGRNSGDQRAVFREAAASQTGMRDGSGGLSLEQNRPNPFNSSTTICFSIPFSGEASLEVLNILGQRVREIFHGHLDQGVFEITVDESIGDLASGIYFYRLKHGETSLVRKMLLLR